MRKDVQISIVFFTAVNFTGKTNTLLDVKEKVQRKKMNKSEHLLFPLEKNTQNIPIEQFRLNSPIPIAVVSLENEVVSSAASLVYVLR